MVEEFTLKSQSNIKLMIIKMMLYWLKCRKVLTHVNRKRIRKKKRDVWTNV